MHICLFCLVRWPWSGQVALDRKGNLIGSGDFTKQTQRVFQNIKNIIEASGGSMSDLKLGFFIKDATQLAQLRVVRDKFINTKYPPVSTLVQVSGLFRKDLLVEIEAKPLFRNSEKQYREVAFFIIYL